VSEGRSGRTALIVPPGARLPFDARDASETTIGRLQAYADTLSRMARIQRSVAIGGEAQIVVGEATYVLALAEFIDLDSEKARLSKGAEAAEKERDSLAQRLANPNFTERAKPEAVEKAKADHEAKAAEAERLRAALERRG